MTITPAALEQFHQFALGKVASGDRKSLTALAAEWEASQREYDETVAELRDCIADMEAGVGRPLREVDAELRAKHGFAPARIAMSLPAYVHPRVVKALDDNVAWWSKHRSPAEAERWYDGIVAAILDLEENPERWPLADEDQEFPYEVRAVHFGLGSHPTHRVLYTIRPDRVYAFLLRHVSQRNATPDDLR